MFFLVFFEGFSGVVVLGFKFWWAYRVWSFGVWAYGRLGV